MRFLCLPGRVNKSFSPVTFCKSATWKQLHQFYFTLPMTLGQTTPNSSSIKLAEEVKLIKLFEEIFSKELHFLQTTQYPEAYIGQETIIYHLFLLF